MSARGRRPSRRDERLDRLAAARAAVTLGPIVYPEQLPVSARREEIAAAIAAHQVVVVSGETGSGKTTQLPKICLELGRGRAGQIGHTQPRRIAARAVAERIAEELGTTLGQAVGYQVRFTDTASDATLVKVMTDGILLAQIQRDPELRAYDTIIVDEAHERSLNIDFLLGYLTDLLPRRPDLKVVITSATIDSAKFAAHFGPSGTGLPDRAGSARSGKPVPTGAAPVIEVTGRTYPVEIRYRPLTPEPPSDDPDEPPGPVPRGGRSGGARGAADRDLMTGICEAVDELVGQGPGDILVFTSGEREIRDATDALRASLGPRVTDPRHPGAVELLPLYSRLSAAEQHRVFEPHTTRRVVLATNVAETSLTVPGVRYVVDPGTARISRYSKTTKVQRLPIEAVSQASADQRAGRCGRVADGVAIRLYSREDYAGRPQFTEPEILRTSLASVILQMIAVGVVSGPDEVARFPFVDPPDVRAVRDGVALLTELGALAPAGPVSRETPVRTVSTKAAGQGRGGRARLTETGRALARLPIDPRLARMIVEAGRRGVAREVVVIAAALSVQDPRERPVEEREAADALHRRFVDPTSDLLGYLNLWTWLRERRRELSSSALRRRVRGEYLNYLRIREWQDVVTQLRQLTAELGIEAKGAPRPLADPGEPVPRRAQSGRAKNRPAETDERPAEPAERTAWSWDADAVHQSVLAGLLSQVGMLQVAEPRPSSRSGPGRPPRPRQRAEYLGARGARFALWPASALAKKPATWVMAAELVETSRLWARDVARIRPEWAEEIGAHLVKRVYVDPGWSARQGAATVTEKVFLYGVPLVADRRVLLAKTDPTTAREMFVRHALVEGEWRTHHRFWVENRRLTEEVRGLEARTRRGLLADDAVLFDFYDARLPDDIVSTRHFDRWWNQTRRDQPDRLTFTPELLLGPEADQVDAGAFPTVWPVGDVRLTVTYHFDPGGAADGVAVLVPIALLPRLDPAPFTWLVPGLRHELITATVRALPKPLRVALVPAPDTAAAVAAWLDQNPGARPPAGGTALEPAGGFHQAFAQAVQAVRDVTVPADAFDDEKLPGHLRVTFRVVSDAGVVLAEGKDLTVLQHQLATQAQDAVSQVVRTALRTAMDEARAASGPRPAPPEGRDSGNHRPVEAGGSPRPGTSSPRPGKDLEQTGLTSWPRLDRPLPLEVTVTSGAGPVRGYPALADEPGTVALRVLADEPSAAVSHRAGLRRLLVADVGLPTARITTRWTGTQALTLAAAPYPSTQALVTDVQLAAVDTLLPDDVAGVRDADAYAAVRAGVRQRLEDETHTLVGTLVDVLTAWRDLDAACRATTSPALVATVSDVRDQQQHLVYDGFVARTPPARLPHLVRYLRAATYRLDRAGHDPHRDQALAAQVREITDEIAAVRAAVGTDPARTATLDDLRWQVEELRVSLFAQRLGTPAPVSAQRIRKVLAKV
ncbi:MAG: ATP-dependent RNA helicase HrpA [Micrococcales bacterium]|nr:ATP-dependent RNA helicase HrpA [Micrococcales bacterium]